MVRAPAIRVVVGSRSAGVVEDMRSRIEAMIVDSICAKRGYLFADVPKSGVAVEVEVRPPEAAAGSPVPMSTSPSRSWSPGRREDDVLSF